ncbi:MAG: hypothetical protein FWC23_04855 [Chitinispirillia bacterium]|nr:hypothetical protein [Chitinispirillia bacterium]MCL2268496.1 hypothetical protein [Chitinispirillia bacterium]
MSFTIVDRETVLLIKYNQESISDLENLKNALITEADSGSSRDTILELAGGAVMYSNEIGVVVQYLKKLPGTGRTLRLVASNYVCEMLKTINIHRIPGMSMYGSLDEVQELFPGVDLGAPAP